MSGPLRIAILVCSDRCSRGEAVDQSGPALVQWLCDREHPGASVTVLPDDLDAISDRLRAWCDAGGLEVVLTCGGTGVSPRDVAPEATRAVLERELPGFGEAMRAASAAKSPHAIISRATAGLRDVPRGVDRRVAPRATLWLRQPRVHVLELAPLSEHGLEGDSSADHRRRGRVPLCPCLGQTLASADTPFV